MITISVNTKGIEEKLLRLKAITGEETGKLLKQEGRLLAIELARYTQPFGFEEEAKKRGEKAIKRDYEKTYPSAQDAQSVEFLANKVYPNARPKDRLKAKERFKKYMQGGRLDAAEKMLRDMHVSFDYSRQADPVYHKNRWSQGRLKSGKSQVVLNRASVSRLISAASKMAGFAKGGWAACARALGGTRGIPQWITRHRNSPGHVIDRTDNKNNPSITLVNDIDYTSQVLSESGKQNAIRDREMKLKERLERILKARAKNI